MENSHMDMATMRESLLAAMLPHVVFDGWSETSLKLAAEDAGISPDLVRVIAPRGAVDLAADYHRAGDRAMEAALAGADMAGLKFRQKVALAVRLRLEGADREIVRRGTAIFALPQNAGTGAQLVWGTADAIWRALGDTSDDVNWYSKRATLSAVYGTTVLYWLGDDSAGHVATWEFLDRRIENVMQFETFKAKVRDNPVLGKLLAGPMRALGRVRAPGPEQGSGGLPGRWRGDAS
jgi:ubiquinone biosynthesis protein COQ9